MVNIEDSPHGHDFSTRGAVLSESQSANLVTDLSIVIVTWNTKRIVAECVESIERSTAAVKAQIIVVDNASTDGTADLIRERFPLVTLICNQENVGFARANNIGIRLCTGDYVFLINSDVVVPEGCLQKMIAYMSEHPDIGMIGPLMRLADGAIGDSCKRFPTVANWFGYALGLPSVFKHWGLGGGYLMTDFRYDRVQDVDILTGWFWLIRRQALAQVGLLDERFFFYGEDLDWPRRFHEAGWRVVFYPEAEAIHYSGASSAKAPTRYYVEMLRADFRYLRKYHTRWEMIGFWLGSVTHEVLRITAFSLAWAIQPSRRALAGHKVKRSAAGLRWLCRSRQ
jgi:GT2 family glycosyltransferase